MELNHDWRGFQSIFQPRRKSTPGVAADSQGAGSMLYLIVDGTRVVAACGAEGEDASSWIGQNVTQVAAQFPHRELVLFTRKEVDQWMSGCVALPHFYEQTEYLRARSVPEAISAQGRVTKVRPIARRHFLLEAVQGWWSKVLPSAYGVFIRLEGSQEIFILVRRGRLELFHSPDLSVLSSEKLKQPGSVVKYLSEKHMVPVQGLFVAAEDWADWSDPAQEGEAWRQLAFAVKDNRAKLVPFRWQVAALGAAKAFLKI